MEEKSLSEQSIESLKEETQNNNENSSIPMLPSINQQSINHIYQIREANKIFNNIDFQNIKDYNIENEENVTVNVQFQSTIDQTIQPNNLSNKIKQKPFDSSNSDFVKESSQMFPGYFNNQKQSLNDRDQENELISKNQENAQSEQLIFTSDINYDKLDEHIIQTHPFKEENKEFKKFSICESLGNYTLPCSNRNEKDATDLAKELGVGPSMFLITIKQLILFYFLMTLVNIPLYCFFYGKNNLLKQTFTDYLAQLTIGVLDLDSPVCSQQNFAIYKINHTNLIQGPSPFSKLQSLQFAGISSSNDFQCNSYLSISNMTKISQYFFSSCFMVNGNNSNGIDSSKLLQAYNSKCLGEYQCYIDISDFGFSDFCMQELYQRWSTSQYLAATDQQYVQNILLNYNQNNSTISNTSSQNYTGNRNASISQNQSIDTNLSSSGNQSNQTQIQIQNKSKVLLEPLIFIVVNCEENLHGIQKEDGSVFYMNRDNIVFLIIATDIVVVICYIIFIDILNWQQNHYADEFQKENIEMNDFCVRIENLPGIKYHRGKQDILKIKLWYDIQKILDNQNYRILDITFGMNEVQQPEHLLKMNDLQNKIKVCNFKIQKLRSEGISFIDDLLRKYHVYKKNGYEYEFQQEQDQYEKHKKQQDEKSKLESEHLTAKKSSRKLFGINFEDKEHFVYAFVVFRSMDGAKAFIEKYNEGPHQNFLIKYLCQKKNNDENKQQIKIDEKIPHVKKADNPTNLSWNHFGCTKSERKLRIFFMWFSTFIVLVLTFVAVTVLQVYSSKAQLQFQDIKNCPPKVQKSDAYSDNQLTQNLQKGLMGCHCYQQVIELNNNQYRQQTFQEFNSNDTILYCNNWFQQYISIQSMEYGIPILLVVINLIACFLFEEFGSFEQLYSVSEQSTSTFEKITILQYFNIAAVLLFTTFNSQDRIQGLPILQGDYYDFTPQWFRKIGAALCFTLLLNTVTPHISKILFSQFTELYRYYDRGFKRQIKKNEDDDDDQEVNTKKDIQQNLVDLYSTIEMPAYYVYAQQFTSIWAIMTYSQGMPILYPIAFINFVILYWVYKFLLVNYYSKSTMFNQELPQSSIFYMKISVVFHCTMTSFMFSSNLLRVKTQYFNQELEESANYLTNINVMQFWFRFRSSNGVIQIGFIIALATFFFVKDILIKLIFKIKKTNFYQNMFPKNKVQTNQYDVQKTIKSEQSEQMSTEEQSNEILEEISITWLDDYYQKFFRESEELRNKKSQILNYLNKNQQNSEIDQNNQILNKMIELYDQRLLDIQKQINIYYNFLKEKEQSNVIKIIDELQSNEKQNNDQIQNQNKSYIKKLKNGVILDEDPNPSFNRKIEKIQDYKAIIIDHFKKEKKKLRMIGVKQTYEIFDSVKFAKAKLMLLELHNKEKMGKKIN